ncbi:Dynein heavy chain 7, axonemal [Allomyces javanicus]|nr:Dynein heavy chain 7, axonemal [Allomyces javanicus]
MIQKATQSAYFHLVLKCYDMNSDGKVNKGEICSLMFGVFSESPKKLYNEIESIDAMTDLVNCVLSEYNALSKKQMDLVTFWFAIEHLIHISRVLLQLQGNMLTIEWQDDSKKIMNMAGSDGKTTVFLFLDMQIQHESFLENINNLLNLGEVPSIYAAYEKAKFIEPVHAKGMKGKGARGTAMLSAFFQDVEMEGMARTQIMQTCNLFHMGMRDLLDRFLANLQ